MAINTGRRLRFPFDFGDDEDMPPIGSIPVDVSPVDVEQEGYDPDLLIELEG